LPYLSSEEINFHRYIEGFFVCLQNYSEESIRHKNRDIYQNRTRQSLSYHGCQRRCYGQYLHVVQDYLANLLHTYC
jgi:hypothetical protein